MGTELMRRFIIAPKQKHTGRYRSSEWDFTTSPATERFLCNLKARTAIPRKWETSARMKRVSWSLIVSQRRMSTCNEMSQDGIGIECMGVNDLAHKKHAISPKQLQHLPSCSSLGGNGSWSIESMPREGLGPCLTSRRYPCLMIELINLSLNAT